ncbi:cytochrome b/b6 domain-containing protein [Corynebacterium sp. MNWGS58]|uniref:cytochrome b/b6 domain-containing protein n=1 Tax=Corynebacterium sp. 102791.4 TaxID=3104612 RepID=UPI0035193A91
MTSTPVLRRGLPRVAGGESWPPASIARHASHSTAAKHTNQIRLRQGLPRTEGGEPWPPIAYAGAALAQASTPQNGSRTASTTATPAVGQSATSATGAVSAASADATSVALRRGLPRVVGGEPWPTVATATVSAGVGSAAGSAGVGSAAGSAAPAQAQPESKSEPTPKPDPATKPETKPGSETKAETKPSSPAKKTETEPQKHSVLDREYGPFSLRQWLGGGLLVLGGIIVLAAIVVFSARWFLGTSTGADFVATYDGHPELPDGTPTGIPAWMSWQHFLNFFFMALIVKTGVSIRYERKAPAYWAAKKSGQKMSLTIWIHLMIDLLWVINGAIFFILLFATGQWARIVPTSFDVFPHAASAAVQYASLDWPTENGWVHYNGLQLLLYFVTVFVVAPLAILTGFRLSNFWPKSDALNKIYPVGIARKMHFPIALYFAVFVIIHVLMVFATGALRNLNHMWAAQGDADPTVYAGNWTGFIFFILGLAVTTAAVVFARPMVLAPVARLFGNVTAR